MNQKHVRAVAIIIIVAMVVTSVSFVAFGAEKSDANQDYLQERLYTLEDYLRFIHDNYVEEVTYKELTDAAFQGVSDALDPYSVYYPSEEEAQAFVTVVDGKYTGIGIEFKAVPNGAAISAVKGGGPAAAAGLHAADIITHIDGKAIAGFASGEIQKLLMGEPDTAVSVMVERDGKQLSFTMVRKTILLEAVEYTMLKDKIAYVKITEFDSDTEKEFADAKSAFIKDGAKAVILDLRDNPGGYLNAAIDIADQILVSGPISHFEKKGNIYRTYSADNKESLSVDMVVLINENTASAAEVLAAALKENKVAKLVGTTTYGKGMAQSLYSLNDDSVFKMSVFYFLTPNRNPIHKVGVAPDYVVSAGGDAGLLAQYNLFAPMKEKVKPGLGSIGLNVYGIQQRLNLLGYKVDITGTLDAKTFDALKRFQGSNGLYPYGIADYTTMTMLDKLAYEHTGGTGGEDIQMKKAIDILNSK